MDVPSFNDRNRESWRLLVKDCIANVGKLRILFFVCGSFRLFFQYKLIVFGLSRTSLLCIVGELAGSVAVGISDR